MQVSLRLDSECVRAFHLLLLQRLAALAQVEMSVDARPARVLLNTGKMDTSIEMITIDVRP